MLGSHIHTLTTIPTAAEKHWEWQPCLLPCCHCNTGDSSRSTGAALLCAWSSESSLPGQAALELSSVWGHCCPLSLFPGIKAGTAHSQQHPGHTTFCPCGLSLVQKRLLQEKSRAICPVQMLENKKLRSGFQSYSISCLTFSITHCKRGFSFGHQSHCYTRWRRHNCRYLCLLDTSRELHGATRGHVIPVCVYTGCAPLLLRHWHQHQKVNCWLSNDLGTYSLIEAAGVQLAPYRTNACKRCYSFSPGTPPLLGPYCDLQSRDYEPFPPAACCSRAAASSSTLPVHGF